MPCRQSTVFVRIPAYGTAIHRQLKLAYASSAETTEVNFDSFRIDAINPAGELIEIQHAGLGAISAQDSQVARPRAEPKVRIVKPIVARNGS